MRGAVRPDSCSRQTTRAPLAKMGPGSRRGIVAGPQLPAIATPEPASLESLLLISPQPAALGPVVGASSPAGATGAARRGPREAGKAAVGATLAHKLPALADLEAALPLVLPEHAPASVEGEAGAGVGAEAAVGDESLLPKRRKAGQKAARAAASLPGEAEEAGPASPSAPTRRKRGRPVARPAEPGPEAATSGAAEGEGEEQPPEAKKRHSRPSKAADGAVLAEAQAEAQAEAGSGGQRKASAGRGAKNAPAAPARSNKGEGPAKAGNAAVGKGKSGGGQAAAKEEAGSKAATMRSGAAAAAAAAEEGVKEEDGGTVAVKPRKARVQRQIDLLPFTDPTAELLARLRQEGYQPPPVPVPNLGYACLNMALRQLKPPIFTSRDCMKRTLDAKGLPLIGKLALANCKDLARLIQWNHENGIRLFRMSSVLLPWMGTYDISDLPSYAEVAAALHFAGDLARAYGQRVTFHPSHFVKLAAPVPQLAAKSRRELEAHSEILDLMGYPPSHWNKINIHIGGVYGDKEAAIRRFAESFALLSPACRARITVENDDVATSFSIADLLELHRVTAIPLVFDFHHHKFCPGGMSEEEAFKAAVRTWPQGVRPVVHWSESQPGRKPHAHSDYVKGPIYLHGLEPEVDVMIEAKCKERALLCYRDGLPIPEFPASAEDGEGLEEEG